MTDICTKLQTMPPHSIDWGEALSHYIARNTSQSYAEQLNHEERIANVLSDGEITPRELLWQSYGGLGLHDPQHWLNLGGSAQTLLEGITFSQAIIHKQQFLHAMKRWCSQVAETTEK